jgi:cytochrome c5
MMGSLYFSEVAGYIPCTLCWYQRILMYPLAGIIAIGLLRRDRGLPYYVLPFSLLGIAFATYHYLLQKTDLFGTSICKVGVPCTSMWINWFGFVTIPFLALAAFIIITLMATIVAQAEPDAEEDPNSYGEEKVDRSRELTPWRPVMATILPVVGIYLVASLLTGTGESHQADPASSAPSVIADMAGQESIGPDPASIDGATLYQQACAACHGLQLEGVDGLGNTLAPSEFVTERSDEEMLAFIRAGRGLDDPDNTSGLVMPESGGRPDLGDAQMLAIVQHMRTAQPDTE